MFNNLKIRSKLMLAFAVVILIGAAATGWNFYYMMQLMDSTQAIAREFGEVEAFDGVQLATLQKQLAERNFILSGNVAFLEQDRELDKVVEARLAQALSVVEGEDEAEIIRAIQIAVKENEDIFSKVVALYSAGKQEEAYRLAIDVYDAAVDEKVGDPLKEITIGSHEEFGEEIDEIVEAAETATVIGATILILTIAIGGAFSMLLAHQITAPIRKLRDVADQVSLGDLSPEIRVNSKDEIGDLASAFDRMVVAIDFYRAAEQQSDG